MGRKRSHPSRLLPFFLSRFAARGGDLAHLLRALDLPDGAEKEDELVVTAAKVQRAGDLMAKQLGDPFFGLHLVQSLGREEWGLVQFLIESAPTLRGTIDAFMQFQPLASRVLRAEFRQEGSEAVLRLYVPGEALGLGAQGNEFALGAIVNAGRTALGGPAWAHEVWFAHRRSGDVTPLREFYGCAPAFGREDCGVRFDAALLETPLPRSDPSLHTALSSHARGFGGERADDFPKLARERARAVLAEGSSSAALVAGQLHMSQRTLQRRLAEHGLSFRRLIEEVRRSESQSLLGDPTLSLDEVAFRVGFSQLSSFIRAFRSWTGKTPGEFRGQVAQR